MPVVHTHSTDEAREALAGAVSPVVVVPVYNGYEDVARCYESLFEHTPAEHAILVVDDCGADRRGIDLLDETSATADRRVVILHREHNGGFISACNDAFVASGRADVVLVNSDVVVGPEWLGRLTAAATSSNLIATASTLTNHGTILSVPLRNRPDDRLPGNITPAEAARRVAAASLHLRPTIPTAIGHCMYVKRDVIDLIGGFDPAFGTGYGEEVDFSQRAITMGYRHVAADDVFTFHRGGVSFGEGASPQQLANESVVNARYSWYRHATIRASTDRFSPLAVALDQARMALTERTIAIDAMCLGTSWTGTQSVTLETICALADRVSDDQLVVLHSAAMTKGVTSIIDSLPNVRRRIVDDVRFDSGTPADVVYRPYQINSIEELRWLRKRGQRVVVNQLDIIAWSNPTYFKSDHAWLSQRELTRLVLAAVDGVAFISEFARREASAEGLLPDSTPTSVVHCGTTSIFDRPDQPGHHPAGFDPDGRPYLLCLGAAYHHKNRTFTMRLLTELHARGWNGRLVLAGPIPPRGNSLGSESAARLTSSASAADVVTLGDLTDAEKRWLYEHAALTVYPTVSEGFGLVPFESATHGVPVLSSRQGSLDEILPPELPCLDGYRIDAAADLAWRLLHDGDARSECLAALAARAERYTWANTASALVELFDVVGKRPPSRVAGNWGEGPAPALVDELLPQRASAAAALERQVQKLLQAETLKRAVLPEGSSRQSAARRGVNWARRTTDRI